MSTRLDTLIVLLLSQRHHKYTQSFNCDCILYRNFGDAENAGLEKSGLENAGTSCAWVAKYNIINVRGHVRANVTAGRGDLRTLQEATQSGN